MADSAPSAASGPLPDRSHIIAVAKFLLRFLTGPQVSQISQQFLSSWDRNKQVMWTGNIRTEAHDWAVQRGKRTLSMAMGPLMKGDDQVCLETNSGKKDQSKYMRGASALFAWFITADDVVTVLCPPPPERFNPAGRTNMQLVELPILIGMVGGRSVRQIDVIHPMVKDAEDFRYQLWPVDEVHVWITQFAKATIPRTPWQQRATTSQVRQIEEFLRSISSDSEDDTIYHVIFPREGSVHKMTATVRPQSCQKQNTPVAMNQHRDVALGNSKPSSGKGSKGPEANSGEPPATKPKISKEKKKKKKKKKRKKKEVAARESESKSSGKMAKEESKAQKKTQGKETEANKSSATTITPLSKKKAKKIGTTNGLCQSRLSTSMATGSQGLSDRRNPSPQEQNHGEDVKNMRENAPLGKENAKESAKETARTAASTAASGAETDKTAVQQRPERVKIKNNQNEKSPQIFQWPELSRVSSARDYIARGDVSVTTSKTGPSFLVSASPIQPLNTPGRTTCCRAACEADRTSLRAESFLFALVNAVLSKAGAMLALTLQSIRRQCGWT